MPVERSAGAIIFHKPRSRTSSLRGKNKEIKYLLLHYPSGSRTSRDYWDLPKGHIEENEDETDTVIREVKEETGLENIKIIEGFKEFIKYFFKSKGKTIFKTVVFYLAETGDQDVKVSFEHTGYKWLLYEEALSQLTFKNAKEILKKANEFLTKHAARS